MRDTISDSDCKGFYVALRKEPEKRSAVEHGINKRGPKRRLPYSSFVCSGCSKVLSVEG